MLAILRTDDWEIALFVHVAGAMLLVGGLLAVAVALAGAWRADGGSAAALTRFAYRTLFFLVLPAFIVMRVAAEWALSEAPFDDDAGWIGVGYITSDLGGLGLIASLVIAGIALRRGVDGRRTSSRVVTVITLVLLVAYVVAIWAMTTKPT